MSRMSVETSATPHRAGLLARLVSLSRLDAVALAAPLAVFVPVALLRSVDGDEGSYLLASKLAVDGRVPYHDFIYPQMPLLPYVYGVWSAIAGESWEAARLLSALLASAVAWLVYAFCARRFGRPLALLGLGLLLSTSLAFGWLTTVKTYALSTLALFAAFMLVERTGRGRTWGWAAAGALVGLAVDTRLMFAAAVPAFAWAAWRQRRPAWFAGGLALGLTPVFVLFAWDPSRFLFDNLEAQGTRSSSGLVGDFPQKLRIAANLLGYGETEGVVGPQSLLLVLAIVAAAAAALALRRRLPLALGIAALLALASFFPTPTYPQYFCVTIPFVVVAVIESLPRLWARVGLVTDRPLRLVVVSVAVAWAVTYGVLAGIDVHRYATDRPYDARLSTVSRVAAAIDAGTRPGEEVLSSWPGYLFGTHARPVPGMENDFSPRNASTISAEKAHRYRMATIGDVEDWLRNRRTDVVVFRLWQTLPPQPRWTELLPKGCFERIGSARIYAGGCL